MPMKVLCKSVNFCKAYLCVRWHCIFESYLHAILACVSLHCEIVRNYCTPFQFIVAMHPCHLVTHCAMCIVFLICLPRLCDLSGVISIQVWSKSVSNMISLDCLTKRTRMIVIDTRIF